MPRGILMTTPDWYVGMTLCNIFILFSLVLNNENVLVLAFFLPQLQHIV